MKALNKSSVVLIAALVAIVGIAYAAQPPNVVESDVMGNTAMGTQRSPKSYVRQLQHRRWLRCALYNTTGTYNTAAGDHALVSNTTGDDNTAAGYCALY